jgi:hypothetical protein
MDSLTTLHIVMPLKIRAIICGLWVHVWSRVLTVPAGAVFSLLDTLKRELCAVGPYFKTVLTVSVFFSAVVIVLEFPLTECLYVSRCIPNPSAEFPCLRFLNGCDDD